MTDILKETVVSRTVLCASLPKLIYLATLPIWSLIRLCLCCLPCPCWLVAFLHPAVPSVCCWAWVLFSHQPHRSTVGFEYALPLSRAVCLLIWHSSCRQYAPYPSSHRDTREGIPHKVGTNLKSFLGWLSTLRSCQYLLSWLAFC